jgi:hypothetical protein
MARNWRGLCPAVDCSGLMMIMVIYKYIHPLSKIHNTSLVSAYFGLDKRECECLEYLF